VELGLEGDYSPSIGIDRKCSDASRGELRNDDNPGGGWSKVLVSEGWE